MGVLDGPIGIPPDEATDVIPRGGHRRRRVGVLDGPIGIPSHQSPDVLSAVHSAGHGGVLDAPPVVLPDQPADVLFALDDDGHETDVLELRSAGRLAEHPDLIAVP